MAKSNLFNKIKQALVEDRTRDFNVPYRKTPNSRLKFSRVNANSPEQAYKILEQAEENTIYPLAGSRLFKEFQGPGRPVTEQKMRDNRVFNNMREHGINDPVFYMKDETGTMRLGSYGSKNSDGTRDYSYEFGPFHGNIEFVTPQERKYMQKWFEQQRAAGKTAREIYEDDTPFTEGPDGNIPSWKDLVNKK